MTSKNFLSLALLSTVACFPKPHFQQNHPQINVQLLQDGEPLSKIPITFQYNASSNACPEPSQTTTSDENGNFTIERTGEDQLFFIYGDRLDSWTICVEAKNGQILYWSTQEFWGGPAEQNLSCQIESKQEESDKEPQLKLLCEDLAMK